MPLMHVFVMDLDGFHQKRAVVQRMTSSDDKKVKKFGCGVDI